MDNKSDILKASSEHGLMAYLFANADLYLQDRKGTALDTVAELVGSGAGTLFSEKDWAFLDQTSGRQFFSGMALLCDLIPRLNVGRRDMMRLVVTLVRLGGEDGAARQPNVAFRDWCAGDPARVQGVLDDARAGDALAIDHLCFALEVRSDCVDALVFLNEGPGSKAQMGAATALGRIPVDTENAAAALHTLSCVACRTDDDDLRLNFLLASFSILKKHADLPRDETECLLNSTLIDPSAEILNGLAHLIWLHGASLSDDEARQILTALQSVDPEHIGTIQKIDYAIGGLLRAGHYESLSDLVAVLIRQSKGKIGLSNFSTFRRELMEGDTRRFGKIIIDWLLDGNYYLCSDMAELFNASFTEPVKLDLQVDDLPVEPEDQLFVCRKAVGFLFLSPVAAAAVLVAILRHGDSQIENDVLGLLHDPLLVNYSGDLRRYLEELVEECSERCIARIEEVLTLAQANFDDLDGIERLVELRPSESDRQIEHIQQKRKMTQAMEDAKKGSIFHDLMTTQYLLYGSGSSTYIEGPDGESQFLTTKLGSVSAAVELPQLAVFDPEGLETMLIHFRYEQRTDR